VSAKKIRVSAYSAAFLAVVGLILFAVTFIAPPTVSAGGAVGSGGGGGSSSGAGYPNTRNGHGWHPFSSHGSGPGTISGTSWSSIARTCRNVNAKTVIAYVINRPDHNPYTGAIYTYKNEYSTYRGFHNGGGGYITLSAARSDFNSLKPSDRAGYTFGSNVGWFCYDYGPPPPPPNRKPSGHISYRCLANGNVTLTFTFSDPDAATHAWVYVGKLTPGTRSPSGGKGSFARGVPSGHAGWTYFGSSGASKTYPTYWNRSTTAWLYVLDSGGGGDNRYHFEDWQQHMWCNHPARGNLAPKRGGTGYAVNCKVITGFAQDDDTPYSTTYTRLVFSGGVSFSMTVPNGGATSRRGWQIRTPQSVRYSFSRVTIHAYAIDNNNNTQHQLGRSPVTIGPCNHPPKGNVNPPTNSHPPGFDKGNSAVNSSCKTISGHVYDPDTPNTRVKVTVSYSVGGSGSTYTNAGSHLFEINTPNSVRYSFQSVRVYVYMHDTYRPGKSFQARGSPFTIGPCNAPPTGSMNAGSSCNAISGTASDRNTPNSTVQIDLVFHDTANSFSTTAYGYTDPNSHVFSITPPQSVKNRVHTVRVDAYMEDTYTGTKFHMSNAPQTIGPCMVPHFACVYPGNINPPGLDPNSAYHVTTSERYDYNVRTHKDLSSGQVHSVFSQTGNRVYQNVDGPNVNRHHPNESYSVTGDQMTTTQNYPASHDTGRYVVSWGITGSEGIGTGGCGGDASNPQDRFKVTDKPYFDVKNGDVSAGSGMATGATGGTNCTQVGRDKKAGIVSWNQRAAGNYAGAGTDYAALALNHLQDFVTGQHSNSLRPDGLAFANTPNNDTHGSRINHSAGFFGGLFLPGFGCTDNYWQYAPNSTVDRGNVHTYVKGGHVTIDGNGDGISGGTVNNGQKITYFVNGDVYINSPIKFSGSYSSTKQIPSFTVVVKGNIYIANDVSRLDGFYVAEPKSNGSGGKIFDCSSGPFQSGVPSMFNTNLYDTCNHHLTVNGAFAAKQVWLLRTAGTVSTTSAETFNYTPEIWLQHPFNGNFNGRPDRYDAISSLPPVL
jgi:hypothetical protein